MPASGWPLCQFFHGSGGASSTSSTTARARPRTTIPIVGEGPGAVVARHGIAAASTRDAGQPRAPADASDYAYLNFNNLSAFPYTFQQGVFEQRMLLDALLALEIPAGDGRERARGVAATDATTSIATKLVAGGHSMGGMYTNMIGAIEPRLRCAHAVRRRRVLEPDDPRDRDRPRARTICSSAILGVDSATIAFMHPALGLLELGWEIAEPIISMARLVRRPLAGTSAAPRLRAGRHGRQVLPERRLTTPPRSRTATSRPGDQVWPTIQASLAVDHLDGIMTYPVAANRDAATTAVVVQYADDGIVDAHYIYRQLDAVKYQYGCFLQTFLRDGVATVPRPRRSPARAPDESSSL